MKAKIKIWNSYCEKLSDEIIEVTSLKDVYAKLPKEECIGTEEMGGVTTYIYDDYEAEVSIELNGKWVDTVTYEDSLLPDDGIDYDTYQDSLEEEFISD